MLEEIEMLTKPYSKLRTNSKKWKIFSRNEITDQSVHTYKEAGTTIVVLSRTLGVVDGYKAKLLFRRGLLRRNPGLFKIIHDLWELINPFKLSGISQKVYQNIFTAIYKIVLKDSYDLNEIENCVNIDRNVDFSGRTWLGFADFYYGMFEYLDSCTKSMLSTELTQFLKTLCVALQDKKWSFNVNLYTKVHTQSEIRPLVHGWMVDLIKRLEGKGKKSEEVPNLIRFPNEIRVSERLLTRKPRKPVDRENFNVIKLEKMMNMQLLREYKQQGFRGFTQSQSRTKFQEKKPFTYYSNYLEKINPLSCMIKQSRSRSSVLEKVIEGRKTINFKSYSQKELLL